MNGSNLPPGVTTSMLPGNTSDDAAWEKFIDWVQEEMANSDHMLTIEEAYMAVRSGIASVKATREDIKTIIKETRQDERLSCEMEQNANQEKFERECQ